MAEQRLRSFLAFDRQRRCRFLLTAADAVPDMDGHDGVDSGQPD
jgi:hypothetical protein